MNILITGGSGTLGTALTNMLLSKNHDVRWFTRNASKRIKDVAQFEWDIKAGKADNRAVENVDVIIHMAGASIAGKRWDKEYKQELRDSRIKSAELLLKTCKEAGHFPKQFITSSAIGYYGYDAGSVLKKEESRFGDDFLATLTKDWEASADAFLPYGVKVAKLRTGIVMSKREGALEAMAKPVKWFIGAPLASGNQIVSWIHEDDVAGSFVHVLENELEGAYNQVAPHPVTNRQLTKVIAKTLHKPLILPPVPGFVVRWMIGEMAASVVGGINVSSEKLMVSGYNFKFTNIEEALSDLL